MRSITVNQIVLLLTAVLLLALPVMYAQKRNVSSSATFEILGKKRLTEKEIEQLGSVYGITLAVRLRLTNNSVHHILYLSNSGTVVPAGYHLLRGIGSSEWES